MDEVFSHTFKAISKRLDERRDEGRRLWQQRLGTASEFCRAVVSNGYLSEEQMQRAAQRYRLGASRDGGVIFWQIDECDLLRDGKIMHYRPDCHRDHDRKPTWASYLLRKSGRCQRTGTMTIVCLGCTCWRKKEDGRRKKLWQWWRQRRRPSSCRR